MKKILLRVDSRSKRWSVAKTFGQVLPQDFPDTFSIKDNILDLVQPTGDVRCTCYTCCDIASDKDDLIYDVEDLWQRIPQTPSGATPQDALGQTVKVGLLPLGQSQRLKPFNSYYEPHTGNFDAFDNVRSALLICKYPIAVWSRWYREWNGQTILPIGEIWDSGHMYTAEGWLVVNNEPMLVIEAWIGHKVYMSREVFNKAVSVWGCGTAVLSTLQMDVDRKKTIVEAITDTIKNILLWIQEQITSLKKNNVYKPLSEVLPTIINPVTPTVPVVETLPLKWDNVANVRHSCRVIMDRQNLSVKEKDLLCAVIMAESGMNPRAVGKPNYDGSRDWGLVQINDKIWIGFDKPFKTTQEVLDNPEKCVEFMIKWYVLGHLDWWIAYKNKSYLRYV